MRLFFYLKETVKFGDFVMLILCSWSTLFKNFKRNWVG